VDKIQDQYLHIFSPTGMWGDQILNLFSSHYHMLNMGKKGIVIHTSKDLFNTHHKTYTNTEKDILKLWSTFNFVKGIFFDVDQRTLQEDGINNEYEMFPHLNYGYDDEYKCDLSQHINFSLFPKRFNNNLKEGYKTAVFQPISLKNKPSNLVNDFIAVWNKSVSALVEKGYWVYVIGTKEDYLEASKIYGPEFKLSLQKDGITNLMGSLSMFEAIDFVMNKSDFVLSCCSWSGWYGIASRTKTAMTLGPLMEEGAEDRKHVCLMKNKDVFFMDYSSKKEEADNNIAEWIKQNA
jgi:hypothetical protein